jgi:uncharacterized protein YhfF
LQPQEGKRDTMMNRTAIEMWGTYLVAHPHTIGEPGAAEVTAWSFGAGPEMETELAELVLAGKKRATASSLQAILTEGEPLPKVGVYSVILDGSGTARCIIRTTALTVVPFSAVTPEFAAREGEGDGSLAYWRDGHRRFFGAEHEELGIPFDETIPVICEDFEVVWPEPPER